MKNNWNRPKIGSYLRGLSCTALFYLLTIIAAHAQTLTSWQGGASGNWNVGANWTNGIPINNTFKAVFSSSTVVDVDIASFSLGQLQLTGFYGYDTSHYDKPYNHSW